jgi:hypothetical protein
MTTTTRAMRAGSLMVEQRAFNAGVVIKVNDQSKYHKILRDTILP